MAYTDGVRMYHEPTPLSDTHRTSTLEDGHKTPPLERYSESFKAPEMPPNHSRGMREFPQLTAEIKS